MYAWFGGLTNKNNNIMIKNKHVVFFTSLGTSNFLFVEKGNKIIVPVNSGRSAANVNSNTTGSERKKLTQSVK